jgi:hypothetical protein
MPVCPFVCLSIRPLSFLVLLLHWNFVTYLFRPWAPCEAYRPSTSACHCPWSRAIRSSSPQEQPVCLASAPRSLLQVFLGRSLFLFPWGLCTWLYIYDLVRSSSKMFAIYQIFKELCPLRDFTFFCPFFSLLTDIRLIFGTLLCHIKILIKFHGFDPFIFPEVIWSLDLKKNHKFSVFCTFFSLCLQIFI